MKKVFIGSIIAIFFATFALAQTTQPLAPDLSLSVIPTDPIPGQQVTVTVSSYAIDVDQATIYWKYDGIAIGQGIGMKSIKVTAPAGGKTSTVTATVNSLGSAQASASLTLRPASVDLLWQAPGAYTPPFYKGKALAPVGGPVKIVAIPAGDAPKQVVYRWSQNDSALQSASGYNKSSIIVYPDALTTTQNVSVAVEGGPFQGSGSISVPSVQPSVVAYLKSEGFIDYAHGFTNAISARGTGITVRFEPFYFSTATSPAADLSFITKVDGTSVIGDPINELRFSRPVNTGATAQISVAISSALYDIQTNSRLFSLSFQ
jgi:hypothetical protein